MIIFRLCIFSTKKKKKEKEDPQDRTLTRAHHFLKKALTPVTTLNTYTDIQIL
jgi:hypothetical protein